MEDLLMQVTGALCGGVGLAVLGVFLIAVLKQFLMIGRPNELLVFSGRQRQLADGSSIGYREVTGGGRAFRIPVLEKVDRMELSPETARAELEGLVAGMAAVVALHCGSSAKPRPTRALQDVMCAWLVPPVNATK